jgi:hypothetical protein
MSELTYASFMVRLWRDPAPAAGPEQEPVWLGELESIQTGRAWRFLGVAALVDLLAAQLPSAPSQPDETDDTL